MKSVKIIPFILGALFLQGCISHLAFRERSKITEDFAGGSKLNLDNAHYRLFVHIGYAKQRVLLTRSNLYAFEKKAESALAPTQEAARENRKLAMKKLHGIPDTSYKIVEIEYLFMPRSTGPVIYISTIADRYQVRYNGDDYLGEFRPNAADFRVFFLGSLSAVLEVSFVNKDGKHKDIWKFEQDQDDYLTLRTIKQKRDSLFDESYSLDDALPVPPVFEPERAGDWEIVYRKEKKGDATRLSGEGAVLKRSGRKYTLIFNFGNRQTTFGDKYIIYDPAPVLVQTH